MALTSAFNREQRYTNAALRDNRNAFCRLGKQLYRLPNIGTNAITNVGLDKTRRSLQRQIQRTPRMNEPRVYVDFNEMVSENEVLLSQQDSKPDSTGKVTIFTEGMQVAVYMDDVDENGKADNLIAEGVALRNHYSGWAAVARWILKINEHGIRHESGEPTTKQ